jgi:hypothetical protein
MKMNEFNLEANKKLKQVYIDKGYDLDRRPRCELRLTGCKVTAYVGFCHRHERVWYKNRLHLLYSFYQTVLGCTVCHKQIDDDKELREKMFKRLRRRIKWDS